MLESLLLKLTSGESLPDPLPADPMPLFIKWFEGAMHEKETPTPEAIALATATADGAPAVRFVLCKKIEATGAVQFFTNLTSRKAQELDSNPRASAVFYWAKQARQVRVDGSVAKLSDAENDAYFATRPLASKIGAWASRQTQPLASREQFAREVIQACKKLSIDPSALLHGDSAIAVPRPEFWGGYRLKIERLELWCGAIGRLHDRAAWTRLENETQRWHATRLYP